MKTATDSTKNDKILGTKKRRDRHLIINNPEKRNAFSLDMSIAAAQVMDDFADDAAMRVIILRGTGGKAFISGARYFQVRRQSRDAGASGEL